MNTKKVSEESISEMEIKRVLKNIADKKVERTSDLKSREKRVLLAYLEENSKDKKEGKCLCHYCGIYCGKNGEEFKRIWEKPCYARVDKNGKLTGRMNLEIEHKNNLSSAKDISPRKRFRDYWDLDNLTLACPICNISKSNQFTEGEFRRVGSMIMEIWQAKLKRLSHCK